MIYRHSRIPIRGSIPSVLVIKDFLENNLARSIDRRFSLFIVSSGAAADGTPQTPLVTSCSVGTENFMEILSVRVDGSRNTKVFTFAMPSAAGACTTLMQ